MSDHDATPTPASGTPRPGEGDDFNARTVLINQDMLDAARAESQQAGSQVPDAAAGAAPGAQAAGSWRPAQPDLPTGPAPEEQTRAYPTGTGRAAAQPVTPGDPYSQANAQPNPYAQPGGFGQQAQQPQGGQQGQFGRPNQNGGAGFGGAASPFQAGQPTAQLTAQQAAQPVQYGQPAQPAWGTSGTPQYDGAAAPASSPFAQSEPGVPAASGVPADPAVGGTPGAATGQETLYWSPSSQEPQVQPAAPQEQQQMAFGQQPAPHSHPFSGGRQDGEVGMSSVFPTATARAEQEAETFVPAAAQPAAQSAPSVAPPFQSQGSAPQWGSAPSSDAAAASQASPFPEAVTPPAGASFGQPVGGELRALAEAERADSLGSWILATFVSAWPLIGLIYLLVVAFGGSRSLARKNWARALFFWQIIGIVVFVIFWFTIGTTMYANSR